MEDGVMNASYMEPSYNYAYIPNDCRANIDSSSIKFESMW